MKTSFYFVLWILIYPILDLFNNSFVENNSFLVALVAVWGVSWLLNRLMPDTLAYEGAVQTAPIMEELYSGNIGAFVKRLRTNTLVESATSAYLLVATAIIAYSIFKVGARDWIALTIFGLLAFGTVSRAIRLNKALSSVRSNLTPEQCVTAAENIYQVDYAAYYEQRQSFSPEQMMPARPRHFTAFRIFSIIMAGICSLLGLIFLVLALWFLVRDYSFARQALATMYLLYGSLAGYFGVRDLVSTIRSFRSAK